MASLTQWSMDVIHTAKLYELIVIRELNFTEQIPSTVEETDLFLLGGLHPLIYHVLFFSCLIWKTASTSLLLLQKFYFTNKLSGPTKKSLCKYKKDAMKNCLSCKMKSQMILQLHPNTLGTFYNYPLWYALNQPSGFQ